MGDGWYSNHSKSCNLLEGFVENVRPVCSAPVVKGREVI